MCLPEIRQKPDGQLIVVSQLGGKRYPPDEEAIILAQAAQAAREAKAKQPDQDTTSEN